MNLGAASAIDFRVTLTYPGNTPVTVNQCFVEVTDSAVVVVPGQQLRKGTLTAPPPGELAVAGDYRGTLSATTALAGTLYAATASQDLGSSNNTQSVAFTYEGPEAGGGIAAGLRWSDLGQQGDFAFVNTGASPPVIKLIEMLNAWGSSSTASSSSLTLTSGNSYALEHR